MAFDPHEPMLIKYKDVFGRNLKQAGPNEFNFDDEENLDHKLESREARNLNELRAHLE